MGKQFACYNISRGILLSHIFDVCSLIKLPITFIQQDLELNTEAIII